MPAPSAPTLVTRDDHHLRGKPDKAAIGRRLPSANSGASSSEPLTGPPQSVSQRVERSACQGWRRQADSWGGIAKARCFSHQFLVRYGRGLSVPDQTALLWCVPDPDRPPWAIRPTRTPPAGIAVIAEPQLSQLLATFGIEPIKARCRRRTVDPG